MRSKLIAAAVAGLVAGFVLASVTGGRQQAWAGREPQTETKTEAKREEEKQKPQTETKTEPKREEEKQKGGEGQWEFKVGWVEVGAKGAILREPGQGRGEGTKLSEVGAAGWEYAGPLSGDHRDWKDSPALFKRPKR